MPPHNHFSVELKCATSSCTGRVKSCKRGRNGAWTEQLFIISKARAYTDFHSYEFYSKYGNIFGFLFIYLFIYYFFRTGMTTKRTDGNDYLTGGVTPPSFDEAQSSSSESCSLSSGFSSSSSSSEFSYSGCWYGWCCCWRSLLTHFDSQLSCKSWALEGINVSIGLFIDQFHRCWSENVCRWIWAKNIEN